MWVFVSIELLYLVKFFFMLASKNMFDNLLPRLMAAKFLIEAM